MLEMQRRGARLRVFAFLSMLACAGASAAFADVVEPPALALANFDFRDTSGEVRDQTAEHEMRLRAFGVALRDGLSENHKIRLVELTCRNKRCTVTNPGLHDLATEARTAGARYLLIGEVHKMSTLVGWVRFAMLDMTGTKAACERFLTYRGDTDEAWRRAARMAARDIGKHCIP